MGNRALVVFHDERQVDRVYEGDGEGAHAECDAPDHWSLMEEP